MQDKDSCSLRGWRRYTKDCFSTEPRLHSARNGISSFGVFSVLPLGFRAGGKWLITAGKELLQILCRNRVCGVSMSTAMFVCLFVFLHSQYGAHLNGFTVRVRVIANYSLSDMSVAGCYLIPATGPWVSLLTHNSDDRGFAG